MGVRSIRIIIWGVLAALWLASACAAQQAISPYIHRNSLFVQEDLRDLEETVGLSPAQREKVEKIMLDASRTFALAQVVVDREYREASEAMYDPATTPEQQQEAQAEYAKKSAIKHAARIKRSTQMEVDALSRIMGLLTPDQIAGIHVGGTPMPTPDRGWGAFECRRRLALLGGRSSSLLESPRELLRSVRLDTDDLLSIQPVLLSYDRKVDILLQERIRAMDVWRSKPIEDLADPKWWQRPEMQEKEINILHFATFHEMLKAVTPIGVDLLWRQRLGQWGNSVYLPAERGPEFEMFNAMTSINDDQRRAAADLAAEADAEVFRACIAVTAAGDDAILRDDAPGKVDEAVESAQRAKQIVQHRVMKEFRRNLQSLLTKQQSEEYDLRCARLPEAMDRLPSTIENVYGSKLVPKERRTRDPMPE